MAGDINRVCCIIDFDGFAFRSYGPNKTTKNEFLIREIGFIKIDPAVGDTLARSFRFDLTFYDFTHCSVTWDTINFQSRRINGLTFKPLPDEEVHFYDRRYDCIEKIYEMCRTPERDIVGFKGGSVEKCVLNDLNIPNLDLSAYGCPKYEDLVNRKMVFSFLRDCGFHKRIDESVDLVHCPMAEVTAFKDWLLFNFPFRPNQDEGNRDLCGSTAGSSLQSSPAVSCLDLCSS